VQAFTVRALDQFSLDIVPPPPASWSASGGGTVSAGGLFTAGATPGGPFTITATSGGRTGSATVTIASGSPPLVVQAATAVRDTPVRLTLAARGIDDAPESALTYTWAALAPPAPVTFGANGTNAAKTTTATLTRAGEYTFVVTLRDGSNLTATSTVRAVVDAELTTLAVMPASVSVAPSATQAFTVVAEDQFGASLLPAPAVAWSVSGGGIIGSSGLLRAGLMAGGPFTVTASAVGRMATAQVTIEAGGAPVFVSMPSAMPQLVTGRATSLKALGGDATGEAGLVYRWRATLAAGPVTFSSNDSNAAKNTVATFSAAGRHSFSLTVENAALKVVTETVEVNVEPTLEQLAVSPAEAQVKAGESLDFTASGVDQFGAALPMLPALTWSMGAGGTIDANGRFVARSTTGGPFVLTAAAGPVTATARVRVTGGAGAMPVEPQPEPVAPPPSAKEPQPKQDLVGEVAWGCQSAGADSTLFFLLVLVVSSCARRKRWS
jgi:plastocyanin